MLDNINIFNLSKKYMWLLIAAFFSALTILTVKYYTNISNKYILLVTILSEVGLIYSYIQVLESGDLLSEFSLIKIFAILIVIIPTILFFKEKITIKKVLGLILAFAAIYLLS